MNIKKIGICLLLSFVFISGSVTGRPVYSQEGDASESEETTVESEAVSEAEELPDTVYVARVIDASVITDFSYTTEAQTQLLTVEIESDPKANTQVETSIDIPNSQFKRPLRQGDRVLIATSGEITANSTVFLVSTYKQNSLLLWVFLLVGLFLIVAGFKSNIKYLQVFLIAIVSGAIVIIFYHRNTFIAFGGLFLWHVLASAIFTYNIFRSKIPTFVLAGSMVISQLVAMGIVFIMKSIDLFSTLLFETFVTSAYDAREVMLYIFALLISFPMSIVFGEQVISESIKKKRDEPDVLKINLIKFVSGSAIKGLNNIFLTLFGLFFSIFVAVVAIASRENVVFEVINSSSLTQILSVGFLMLFNLIIYIPLVSFVTGMWLGRLESHELVTDKNLKQLEL